MILIKGNVERIASTAVQAEKLKALGFQELAGGTDTVSSVSSGEPSGAPAADISKMNVAGLRALAKEKGIEGTNALKKDELLEILKDVV